MRLPSDKEKRPPLPTGTSLRSKITKQVTIASKASAKKNIEVGPALRVTPFTDQEIKETFELFDLNKNGYVGAAEIRYILDIIGQEVSDEEIDEMIRLLDVDGDGQVNFPQFRKMATGSSLAPIGVAIPPPLQQFTDDDLRGGFTRNFSSAHSQSKPSRTVRQYKSFKSENQTTKGEDPGSDYEQPPAPRNRGQRNNPGLIYQPEINRRISSSESEESGRAKWIQQQRKKEASKFGGRRWIQPPPL